jgi:glycosyltransferase involved in cell wall biosynthesis
MANANNPLERPTVMIYAPHLLVTFQHYIREHALRLRRYRPVLAGRRRVPGIPISDLPHFLIGPDFSDRPREFHFLLTGQNAGLQAFILKNNVRLIHAHFGPGGSEIMQIASRLGIPMVVTFHGWDVKLGTEASVGMNFYERLYRRRLPRLLQSAKKVICVSHSWRERVIALGCPPDKCLTNYLGVDAGFFDGERGTVDPYSLLYVGRLIPRKGVHILLEAVEILRQRGCPVNLTIAGDGPERERLERISSNKQLPVTFLGKRSSHEVRELLRKSAVLCAPSTTSNDEVPEALGLILLEAQAMRVPVVGTRCGGIPETLKDGETGFLVGEDSPAELADALARLLGNEAASRLFGERGREFVARQFDICRCYAKLEGIYDEVLQTAAVGGAMNGFAVSDCQTALSA